MNRREPLHPLFDFSAVPEPVHLGAHEATLHYKDKTYTAAGSIQFRSVPYPRIVIHAQFPIQFEDVLTDAFGDTFKPAFFVADQPVPGFHGRWRATTDSGLELDWIPGHDPMELWELRTGSLACVQTHLFNFPRFRATQHHRADMPPGRANLLLESAGWRILVQNLEGKKTDEAWRRIDDEGIATLTHVARLERKDGRTFAVDDAKEQLFLLAQFLSFVKGTNNVPVCSVGFTEHGEPAWHAFSAPCAGEPPCSWAVHDDGQQMEALFPMFVARWDQSEAWRDCLKHAIYWYNQANTRGGQPGIDSALVLAQSALERLAYHHAVIDRRMISKAGFKKLVASDKLRMLLSSLHIPVGIPDTVPAIRDAAKQLKWVDAAHAGTEVRNSLVHPENKLRGHKCYLDAWKLALWQIELATLALCGYEGTYRNRLAGGAVEQVPWM